MRFYGWPEFQPRAPAEAFITRRQDGRTTRAEQVLRRQRRHGAPQEDPGVGDDDEKPGSTA